MSIQVGSARSASPVSQSPQRRPATRIPAWWRDLTGATAWMLVLFVVALWVAGGGLTAFGSATAGLTSLGRLAGLVASVLMLLQVLLMARIPMVEQAWGQDELARVHRLVGFTSFNLMVAHIVLIIAGYNLADASHGFVGTFLDQVLNAPGMLLATAGTVALCMVVVTSVRAARRRLRYESWHLLHLYAYLGTGLALPHQLWTGTDFIDSPWSRAYWWTLYALAAGAVVVYRLGRPAWRTWRHRLTVSHVVAEGPGLTSVYLRGHRLHALPVRAGQFFQWRFLDGRGW